MTKFSILLSDGTAINHTTKLTRNGQPFTPSMLSDLVRIVVSHYKKVNSIKTLHEFTDEDFTIDMVRDQIHTQYTINVAGKHVDFHAILDKFK